MNPIRSRLVPGALLGLLVAVAPASAAPRPEALAAFRSLHGEAWELGLDATTARPRRLVGGSLELASEAELAGGASVLVERARAFLREQADLLDLEVADLGEPVVAGSVDGLAALHFVPSPAGVPVEGARVSLAVKRGRLLAVHLVGTGPVAESPMATLPLTEALDVGLARLQLPRSAARVVETPRLVFLPRAGGHDLAWRYAILDGDGRRHRAFVHARSGALLRLTDETVEACDPPPPGGTDRRVLGGVRIESGLDPERVELLPFVSVGDSVSAADGFFTEPLFPGPGLLDGPVVELRCTDCTDPVQPTAGPDAVGDVDFGSGGGDAVGNGRSTPADRATWFHVASVRSQARRWMDLPWLDEPIEAVTNVVGGCNARWNGAWLSFERSTARCSNSGEIRDVIAHEYGHALDEHDGLPPAGLSVDAATGEAIADLVAMLRSRNACIGEGFFLDPAEWPSADCSGVRDLDELSPGHRHGAPGTLSTANVDALCPPSAFYRGPLGREGHCEGEILGQAAWHLVRNLVTGSSHADGTPLGGTGLGEEAAWQVMEALVYRALPLLASHAPSHLQSLGTSAHEALLLADDEGDGIANGTPHSWAIDEAFEHHGLQELGGPRPAGTPCTPPPEPIVVATTLSDANTGLPIVRIEWNDTGADRYLLLKGDDDGSALLPLAEFPGLSARSHDDRAVLPGRLYRYAVVAVSATGCASAPGVPVVGSAGAFLRVVDLRLDDSVGGNGDGRLQPNEQADVEIDVENLGSSPATGLSVTLASLDPSLLVLDPGPIDYGDVAPGATAVAPAAFRVEASPGVRLSVELAITGEAAEGCLRADRTLVTARPLLELASHRIDDSAGSGDLVWDPGESIDLFVTMENAGTDDARAVTGEIWSPVGLPPGVTIDRNSGDFDDLAPGAAGELLAPGFALSADPAVEPGTVVVLTVATYLALGPHSADTVELVVGGFPPGRLEWSTSTRTIPPLDTGQVVNLPLVLQTNDDDGDGRITACDVPDLVFEVWNIGAPDEIVLLNGADGSWIRSFPVTPCRGGWSLFQALAGADVDGDGEVEILTEDMAGHACAFELDGTLLWKTVDEVLDADFRPYWGRAAPQVWDLDHDGTAEVVIGLSVTEGADGTVDWAALVPRGSGRSLVGDLDLDGELEILSNRGELRGADGTDLGAPFTDFWSMGGLVNLDDDPNPEVVYVAWVDVDTVTLEAREHDGAPIWTWTPPASRDLRCPPCFGDFDGDGHAETALPIGPELVMIDHDGNQRWSLPVSDSSGAAGCSVFDFDLDGRPEILHHDERDLRVIDGATGAVLWTTPHRSQTQHEFPLVVDVDGDGSAEIVAYEDLGGNSSELKVWGNPRWPPSRGTWNQEEYSVTHGTDAGAVVSDPAARWLTANDFRGQAVGCACGGPGVSFRVDEPGCDSLTACFRAEGLEGIEPYEFEWDFGDGSAPGGGAVTCHEFPAPGRWTVRLSLRDAAGCEAETAAPVEIPEPLSVTLDGSADCDGVADCFAATVTGGVPPFELSWSFDGEAAAPGLDTECRDLPGPGWSAAVFVRDARGCLAEARLDGLLGSRPADVGPVLFGVGHGDPDAPTVEADFDWRGDLGAPRPPGESYVLRRATRPDLLDRIAGTEGWTATAWTDGTPRAVSRQVHFLRVFAESECGLESED